MNKTEKERCILAGASSVYAIGLKFWAQAHASSTPVFHRDLRDHRFKGHRQYLGGPLTAGPSGLHHPEQVGSQFRGRHSRLHFPVWINTVAAGDFDNDGWPDFVGTSSSLQQCLVFVRNLGANGQVGTSASPTRSTAPSVPGIRPGRRSGASRARPSNGDGSEHCGMTAGDYDGDGDPDFFYVVPTATRPITIERIWLYENRLIRRRQPFVYQTRTTDRRLAGDLKGIAWSTTMHEHPRLRRRW